MGFDNKLSSNDIVPMYYKGITFKVMIREIFEGVTLLFTTTSL
jgi:hypothetical protein